MKKILLAGLILGLSSSSVFADDDLMEVDQVVEYVSPEEDSTYDEGTISDENTVLETEYTSFSDEVEEVPVEEPIFDETEFIEEPKETESPLPDYYRVTLEKVGVKITVPVFNEGDTWQSKYSADNESVAVEYSIKEVDPSVEDYLAFSAEKYENSLKDSGLEDIENSGILETDTGLSYLGIFGSKDGVDYKIYYGTMPLKDNKYVIIKIIGSGDDSTISDLMASEFGFQRLKKYRENQGLTIGFNIVVGGDEFDLPVDIKEKEAWVVEKESSDGEYGTKTLENNGYKINIKTYKDEIYSVSVMTYNCDIENPEVTVFDGKVGFGSSEGDLVNVLEELGLAYEKVETTNEGSQYTVEDEYNSGYTFIIMNDKIYSISVMNQGYIFEQQVSEAVETETEVLDLMERLTENSVGEING